MEAFTEEFPHMSIYNQHMYAPSQFLCKRYGLKKSVGICHVRMPMYDQYGVCSDVYEFSLPAELYYRHKCSDGNYREGLRFAGLDELVKIQHLAPEFRGSNGNRYKTPKRNGIDIEKSEDRKKYYKVEDITVAQLAADWKASCENFNLAYEFRKNVKSRTGVPDAPSNDKEKDGGTEYGS